MPFEFFQLHVIDTWSTFTKSVRSTSDLAVARSQISNEQCAQNECAERYQYPNRHSYSVCSISLINKSYLLIFLSDIIIF
jgi:hypothetical protein